VTPPAAAGATEPAPAITVYYLKHAKADEMVRLLAGVLETQKARLAVDSRTNSLLFQGTPEAARIVEAILLKFDRAESQPERAMQVFQLKFAEAQDVAKVLTGTLEPKNARWSVDSRRNCLVFYGTQEAADLAKKLIAELDRPAAPREAEPEMTTRVYQVKHANASLVLQVLQTMLADRHTRMAVDQKTNSLVIAAPQDVLQNAAELIQKLDIPEAGRRDAKPRMPCQLRIVWLGSGLSSKDAPAPSEDLKQVVEQLSGLGVKDVRQVGQMIVNTQDEGRFQVSCSPLFDGALAHLTASGVLVARGETSEMSLKISATQVQNSFRVQAEPGKPGSIEQRLVNIETVIEPRFDPSHYVVLGVAPVGKVTSIFVVQVRGLPR
jgi:hypothetical protein